MLLIVGTIPAVVVGFLFSHLFDSISKTGITVGWEFLFTRFILWMADGMKNGSKRMESIGFGDALFIGSFQAAAIFPAVSRSGLTIAAGLFRNLDRETAAYFSFYCPYQRLLEESSSNLQKWRAVILKQFHSAACSSQR